MSLHVDVKKRRAVKKKQLQSTVLKRWQYLVGRIAWRKVGIFVVSLFLFILAITLMKEGARGPGAAGAG